jgi:hypothetical protein
MSFKEDVILIGLCLVMILLVVLGYAFAPAYGGVL